MEEEEATVERLEAVTDAQTLSQVPVLETSAPHLGVLEADTGSHAGYRNPGTPEVDSDEKMLPGWKILKGLFLGNYHNRFKNLSRLAMLWTVRHMWSGGAHFDFNCYMHIMQLLILHPRELDPEDLMIREGVI